MDFDVVRIDESSCSLELLRDGKAEPVKLGDDATLDVNSHAAENVEATAVFVGYGLTVPELHYDDLAGLDVKGKIAVFVTGGPADMSGPIKAHYQSGEERRRAFAKAGIIGAISIPNPRSAEVPWSRMAASRFQQRMELRDPGHDVPPPYQVTIQFNPARAEMLFSGSGHAFQEILEALNADKPLQQMCIRDSPFLPRDCDHIRVPADTEPQCLPEPRAWRLLGNRRLCKHTRVRTR